ncbi:MAG: M15 family metallopeptidase [Acutalibacter sp.]|nr:M15 family metallopeptidase [Acutalibacter sp.]
MNKAERDRAKMERERIRKRNLFLVKLAGVCLLAVLAVSLLVSAVSSMLSGSDDNPDSSDTLNSAVGSSSDVESAIPAMGGEITAVTPSPSPSPTPKPEDPRLSDPLLVLVNADNPLPDDWQIDPMIAAGDIEVDVRAHDNLVAMLYAANADGVNLWLASGYRSVEQQEGILNQAIQSRINQLGMSEEEAREDALLTINLPGCSEHHTGLAVDFNDVSDDFESTDAYYWLASHAAEYGFVQRYKQSKVNVTGISNESWHYRYVGKEYAEEMERLDLCLEEYRDYLKN